MKKIAIALLHGSGRAEDHRHAAGIQEEIVERAKKEIGEENAQQGLVFEAINWAPAFGTAHDDLWFRLREGPELSFLDLRRFMLYFAADAIAYQPMPGGQDKYQAIHTMVAAGFKSLAERAGDDAALCIVAHSLGTVIASNYLWDLQRGRVPAAVAPHIGTSPLERGDTLALLFTMGSPLALWSLRYPDFGEAIAFPAPELEKHHPRVWTEWVNFFDKDDILGYPVQTLNEGYRRIVVDREVNAGGFLWGRTPASHGKYWEDKEIARYVAGSLSHLFLGLNEE